MFDIQESNAYIFKYKLLAKREKMRSRFYKYHGAGNDFILVDDFEQKFPRTDDELIRKMCNRHFGIGSDGLILLCPSEKNDFGMIYYNSDGHPGSMCGNGGRCLLAFARDRGRISGKDRVSFDAVDGIHEGEFVSHKIIRLKMNDAKVPQKNEKGYFVNSGSPHHVEYVDNLRGIDVEKQGQKLRAHKMYAPEGCNVNFIKEEKNGSLSIRTYERGVEAETLACGTGAVASAIVHYATGHKKDAYEINARGGKLKIYFRKNHEIFSDVWLEGPAVYVFEGEIKE